MHGTSLLHVELELQGRTTTLHNSVILQVQNFWLCRPLELFNNCDINFLDILRLVFSFWVRKEAKRIIPDFCFKKSVERLSDGIKNVMKSKEVNNQHVVNAVRHIEKKIVKKGSTVLKFKEVSIDQKLFI